MDDPRPDELLEECGRLYWRLNLAIAWTDGIADDRKAKTCSRSGSAAWKNARPLRDQVGTEDAVAAFFRDRARMRNPVVTAGASALTLIEYDGDRDELDRKHGLQRLPATLGWRSRRGPHFVFRTPPGIEPIKVQIDADGITVSTDGYLVCAPAWRAEYGVVYELNGSRDPVLFPAELRALLLDRGGQSWAETRRRFAEGELIPEGQRDISIFRIGVDLLREGVAPEEALDRLLEVGSEQCDPPLKAELVRKQFAGAVKFVAANPTEAERARAKARRLLHEHRTPREREHDVDAPRTAPGTKRRRALER